MKVENTLIKYNNKIQLKSWNLLRLRIFYTIKELFVIEIFVLFDLKNFLKVNKKRENFYTIFFYAKLCRILDNVYSLL